MYYCTNSQSSQELLPRHQIHGLGNIEALFLVCSNARGICPGVIVKRREV